MRTRDYVIGGLRIRSAIELWCPPSEDGPVDVSIGFGEVPTQHPAPTASGAIWEGDADEMLLTLPEHGRFWLKSGREVAVQLLPGGCLENVQAFLMATVFGVLCHQRSLLPMHASAVAVHDAAILVAGDSGAGKSTMAAALSDRGLAVLSDDISVVRWSADGRPEVSQGGPYIRLWEDALRRLGRDPSDYPVELPNFRRFRLSTPPARRPTVPLSAIYILREARLPGESGFARLAGLQAITALRHNIFRRSIKVTMGQEPQIFAWCSRLAREIPVFLVCQVRDLSQLSDFSKAIHLHAEATVAATQPR